MTEFPGWEQIALEDELRSAFQIPVYLEHDANAGALAEWWLGPHSRETGTMVYVAAGQGIGAGSSSMEDCSVALLALRGKSGT